jgi:acetyltransferase-like isoleucine patch superfamily enzyme
MSDPKPSVEQLAALLAGADEATLRQLMELLRQAWIQRRREVDARWKRTLPFGDYVVDRWERARELGFGEGTSIYDSVLVLGDVHVGARTWIGPFTILDGSGGLTIGDNCSISSGVHIYTHETVQWALSGGAAPYEYAPVRIGSNCYIGPQAIIAKGVTIGDGALVGANSLVLGDVPAGAKAYGNPARVVPA